MKKISVFLLIVFALTALLSRLSAEEFDIRKLKWGMSFEDVQRIEGLKSDFYKEEENFAIKTEIFFVCDMKGLRGVTYSTPEKIFADEVSRVLKKKYGDPKVELDYSYILRSKEVLKKYPDIVQAIYEKGDFSKMDRNTELPVSDKRIIRAGLSKRAVWEYGNTIVLLLNSMDGVVVSYWSKTFHSDNKKKFSSFLNEIKNLASESEARKKAEDGEKF